MKIRIVILVLLLSAFSVSLHQFLNWGYWFEFSDLHHETVIISFVFASIMLIVLKSKIKRSEM